MPVLHIWGRKTAKFFEESVAVRRGEVGVRTCTFAQVFVKCDRNADRSCNFRADLKQSFVREITSSISFIFLDRQVCM